MSRPHSPDGDPDAQRCLCIGMPTIDVEAVALTPSIRKRTRLIDGHVMRAISDGIAQVVILGAGFDDRALRFKTAGVRFFEVDHPATQAAKCRNLERFTSPIDSPALVMVPCDFEVDDLGESLELAGHDPSSPSLVVCEGVLVYLERESIIDLLAQARFRSAGASRLVSSIAIHQPGLSTEKVLEAANARRRGATSEPWRTIVPIDQHLELIETAGWKVDEVIDLDDRDEPASDEADSYEGLSRGSGSLLVVAHPASS